MALVPQNYQPSILNYNNALSQSPQAANMTAQAIQQHYGTKAATTGGITGGTLSGGGGAPASSGNLSNPYQGAQDALNAQNNALLSQLNTQHDQYAADASAQMNDLGTQRDTSVKSLDDQLSGAQTTVNNEKTTAQTNNDNQVQDAGSIAHSTQMQNRNILRSLGILNSSAAGEMLSKPIDQFDQQRAQLGQALTQRFSQLDDFYNQQVSAHQNAISQIQNNYQSLVGKIQSDLRFNDRQRADAIQAANAALQGHLADIQSSIINYQNQIAAQKQAYGQQAQQLLQYQQPTANTDSISNTGISGANQTQQGVDIYGQPIKRDQGSLSGLGQ